MRLITRTILSSVLAIWAASGLNIQAQVALSTISRLPDGTVRLTMTGDSAGSAVLQASSDLRSWQDLYTFTIAGTPATYTDTGAASARNRSYRVRTGGSAPASLPDLGELANRVFPAPEGRSTIQFAANGTLGFIAWRDRDLIYRERTLSGSWSEKVVNSNGGVFKPYLVFDFSTPREDYRFQPSSVLLFNSSSQPHIFQASGRNILHFSRNSSGNWELRETIPNPVAGGNIDLLEGVIGAGDVFHFGVLSSGSPRSLTYGSNRNGQWNWTAISTVVDPPLTYWAPPFAARWLDLAVDSRNNAHFAFRSSLDLSYHSAGYPRAYSELKYASNASDQWRTVVVIKPRDISGEAANGAAIAIGPDDKPRLVSWYDERADTGSAQESRLYYHQLDSSGSWSSSVILSTPAGYSAGDGEQGTGFSPSLKFDSNGRPHILFLDHASEHFGGIGQQEYAGNVRHGWWNGAGWSFETVFQQSAPLRQQAVYPVFALSAAELAVTVLQRDTNWKLASFPPVSDSKYYFRFFTKPLQP